VHQGDPLSPLRFCLAEEVLSRALEMERISNSLQPMNYCQGMSLPTHILYADDVFICCVGSKRNIRCLLRVFRAYSEASGQFVNYEKSKMFTGAMTDCCPKEYVGSNVRIFGWYITFPIPRLPHLPR